MKLDLLPGSNFAGLYPRLSPAFETESFPPSGTSHSWLSQNQSPSASISPHPRPPAISSPHPRPPRRHLSLRPWWWLLTSVLIPPGPPPSHFSRSRQEGLSTCKSGDVILPLSVLQWPLLLWNKISAPTHSPNPVSCPLAVHLLTLTPGTASQFLKHLTFFPPQGVSPVSSSALGSASFF